MSGSKDLILNKSNIIYLQWACALSLLIVRIFLFPVHKFVSRDWQVFKRTYGIWPWGF